MASDAALRQPPTNSLGSGEALGWILHGLHDEAKHNGEMYLVWKLYQKPSGRSCFCCWWAFVDLSA